MWFNIFSSNGFVIKYIFYFSASVQVSCDFEDLGSCGYLQVTSINSNIYRADQLNWRQGRGFIRSDTGPRVDHTLGNNQG